LCLSTESNGGLCACRLSLGHSREHHFLRIPNSSAASTTPSPTPIDNANGAIGGQGPALTDARQVPGLRPQASNSKSARARASRVQHAAPPSTWTASVVPEAILKRGKRESQSTGAMRSWAGSWTDRIGLASLFASHRRLLIGGGERSHPVVRVLGARVACCGSRRREATRPSELARGAGLADTTGRWRLKSNGCHWQGREFNLLLVAGSAQH
jgi:hypothetical protein